MAASPSPPNHDLSPSPPANPLSIVTVAASGGGAGTSRRLPPPCWSNDESIALIEAYREKWYSLKRSHLRANHWQEIADEISVKCPVNPPKTAVQCRHKMEKLRKRYRAEIQRAAPYGGARSQRYWSSWVLFKLMDDMERGPNADAAAASPPDNDKLNEDAKEINNYNQNSNKRSSFQLQGTLINGGGGGVRIRIPTLPIAKPYSKLDEMLAQNPNPNGFVKRSVDLGKKVEELGVEKRKGDDPVGEMVTAIKALGDGFLKMERMKMDLARELEDMRMDMEMKRTQMILESQQRIVEAFANALAEKNNKRTKRMPTPECHMA